jgi:hypothetical protein
LNIFVRTPQVLIAVFQPTFSASKARSSYCTTSLMLRRVMATMGRAPIVGAIHL